MSSLNGRGLQGPPQHTGPGGVSLAQSSDWLPLTSFYARAPASPEGLGLGVQRTRRAVGGGEHKSWGGVKGTGLGPGSSQSCHPLDINVPNWSQHWVGGGELPGGAAEFQGLGLGRGEPQAKSLLQSKELSWVLQLADCPLGRDFQGQGPSFLHLPEYCAQLSRSPTHISEV